MKKLNLFPILAIVCIFAVGIGMALAADGKLLPRAAASSSSAAQGPATTILEQRAKQAELDTQAKAEAQEARILARQIWALAPPILGVLAGCALVWRLAANAAHAWNERETIRPDRHGQLPTVKHKVDDDTVQYVNLDKLASAVAAFRRGVVGMVNHADPRLQEMAELGWWTSRIMASLPYEVQDHQGAFQKAVRNKLLGIKEDPRNPPPQIVRVAGDALAALESGPQEVAAELEEEGHNGRYR